MEKGQQVAMIGDIFGQASNVLVWVGEHGDRSQDLFIPRGPALQDGGQIDEDEQARRFAIWEAFLRRRYWTRLWVVQEFALAKDIEIFCGDSRASKEMVLDSRLPGAPRHRSRSTAAALLDHVSHWDGLDIDRLEKSAGDTGQSPTKQRLTRFRADLGHVLSLCRLAYAMRSRHDMIARLTWKGRDYALEKPHISLLSKLFSSFDCADPRDRIYALIGLDKRSRARAGLRPDYTIDEAELFVRASVASFTAMPDAFWRLSSSYNLVEHQNFFPLLRTQQSARRAFKIVLARCDDEHSDKQEADAYAQVLQILRHSPDAPDLGLPQVVASFNVLTAEGRAVCRQWVKIDPEWIEEN